AGNHFSCLSIGEHLAGNLVKRTTREMVGAAPVCPPERPRSGVSIRKRHVLTRKSGISTYHRYVRIRKCGISTCHHHLI
ncbi:MAG: hypothetical protein ACFNXZ_10370, partial [Lautropia mirabilis]